MLAVFGVMNSAWPICRVVRPAATLPRPWPTTRKPKRCAMWRSRRAGRFARRPAGSSRRGSRDLQDRAWPGGVGDHLVPEGGAVALGALLHPDPPGASGGSGRCHLHALRLCLVLSDRTCRRRRGRSPRLIRVEPTASWRRLVAVLPCAREPAGHTTVRRALVRVCCSAHRCQAAGRSGAARMRTASRWSRW
jgi:hypothetical protein